MPPPASRSVGRQTFGDLDALGSDEAAPQLDVRSNLGKRIREPFGSEKADEESTNSSRRPVSVQVIEACRVRALTK